MFDCYDTVHAVLQVTAGVMSTLKVRDFRSLLRTFEKIKTLLGLTSTICLRNKFSNF